MSIYVNKNSLWHSLSEHHQHCIKRGVPFKYLGASLANDSLAFTDYEIQKGFAPVTVTGEKQRRWLLNLKASLVPASCPTGLIGLHSAPTDYSAFRAAASLFEAAVHRGLVAHCISITEIKETRQKDLPNADVYVIHGLTNEVVSSYTWPLRDFIRSKSTSLILLVMTSPQAGHGLQMQREVLRMNEVDVMVCLEDNHAQTGVRYS